MRWPERRTLAMAVTLGAVLGGAVGIYSRLQSGPVGHGGGVGPAPGLVTIGSPPGGGGWITIYRGMEEAPFARTRVPWQEYDDAVGAARPVPMRLADGPGQQIVVALDPMPGQVGGWFVVLDSPENGCRPLAWRNVALGRAKGAQAIWIAGADLDGDGLDEVVVGSPQAQGDVLVLGGLAQGLKPLATLRVPWKEYDDECGETRPAAGDLDGDGRAEIVVSLARWQGRGGWAAVYEGFRLSRWARYPDAAYNAGGGGTWPAIGKSAQGSAQLLLSADGAGQPRIAVLSDPLGKPTTTWIDIPAEVSSRCEELRPLCADLDGDGGGEVLALVPDDGNASAMALFAAARLGHAFLGWRMGMPVPDGATREELVDREPGAEARTSALAALEERRAEIQVYRGEMGRLSSVDGTLSESSGAPPLDRALSFLRDHGAAWGITDPSREMVHDADRSILELDDCKTTHVALQQAVSGLPLLDHALVVHMDEAGVVTAVDGDFDPLAAGQDIDTRPRVSKDVAVAIVKQEARARLANVPKPELATWRGDGPVRLCWKAQAISFNGRFSREYVIDALAGSVLEVRNRLATDLWEPTNTYARTTLGRGEVPLRISHQGGVSRDQGTYAWIDRWRLAWISTGFIGDLNGFSWMFIPFSHFVRDGGYRQFLWDPPRVGPWTTVRHDADGTSFDDWLSPCLMISESAAAHRNMSKVFKYWYEDAQLGLRDGHRQSWDDRHGDISVMMEYRRDSDGLYLGSDNAMWYGQISDGVTLSFDDQGNVVEQETGRTTGAIVIYPPVSMDTLTPLDVLGHEFGHAVVSKTLRLDAQGSGGGLGEHIADAWGTFAEYREGSETEENPGPRGAGWWIMGEECRAGGIRDLRKPSGHDFTDYRSVALPNCAPSNDFGYVHDNGHILGHWLYLWIQGGDHEWMGRQWNGTSWIRVPMRDHLPGLIGGGVCSEGDAFSFAERAYYRMMNTAPPNPNMRFEEFAVWMMRAIWQLDVRPGKPIANMARRAFAMIHLTVQPASGTPPLTSPRPGSRLSWSTETFSWSAVPGATQYWMSIGTVPGGSDILDGNQGRNTSVVVGGLPTDGRNVCVRLWFKRGGIWHYHDLVYQAAIAVGGTGRGPDRTAVMPWISQPRPDSVLTSESATFGWSSQFSATRFLLQVGSSPGARDLFNRFLGLATSATVSGLPTDGRKLYVRLWYYYAGEWRYVDRKYLAARLTPATIIWPPPGSDVCESVTFLCEDGTWTQYRLDVGTTPGGREIASMPVTRIGWGGFPGAMVEGLPRERTTLYVRLWSGWEGEPSYLDATYHTAPFLPPTLVYPEAGSVLSGFWEKFHWSWGRNVHDSWLCLGTTRGGHDVLRTRGENTMYDLTVTALDLPTRGEPLYAYFKYFADGAWHETDVVTYRASSSAEAPPRIVSPVAGSTLPSSTATVTFSIGPSIDPRSCRVHWAPTAPEPGMEGWSLGWTIDPAGGTSATLTGLPMDHGPVYVWLTYGLPPGPGFSSLLELSAPHSPYVTYWAAHADSGAPVLRTPLPGSTWTSSSVSFSWSPPPGPYHWNGDHPGWAFDLRPSLDLEWSWIPRRWRWRDRADDPFPNTEYTRPGLPSDGRRIYARPSAQDGLGNRWIGDMVDYSSATGGTPSDGAPILITPAPGSVLGSGTTTFRWGPAADPDRRGVFYWLRVGSSPGAMDIFDQVALRGETSLTVSGLPADGRAVYVRLDWDTGEGPIDFVCHAAGGASEPEIATPPPDSTLSSSQASFAWVPVAGATLYRLRVAVAGGGPTVYDHFEGTALTAFVPNLPTDGSTLSVTLSCVVAGTWREREYTYRATLGGSPTQGQVWAWGSGHAGRLGNAGWWDSATPVPVRDLSGVTAMAAAGHYSLALHSNGTIWTWGIGPTDREEYDLPRTDLGPVPPSPAMTPARVPGLSGVASLVALGDRVCAVKSDGTLWGWGHTIEGYSILTPTQVQGIADVRAVAGSTWYTLALKRDGTLWRWNDGGGRRDERTPVQFQLGSTEVAAIAAGEGQFLVLMRDGTVWRQRMSQSWQTIDGSIEQVPGLSQVTAITYAYDHFLALRSDGIVWAWGHNPFGELGNGTNEDSMTPVQVQDLDGVVAIAAGAYVSAALKGDGTVWVWGNNHFGQLGTSTRIPSFVPVRIPGLTDIAEIAAGGWHLLARKRP